MKIKITAEIEVNTKELGVKENIEITQGWKLIAVSSSVSDSFRHYEKVFYDVKELQSELAKMEVKE